MWLNSLLLLLSIVALFIAPVSPGAGVVLLALAFSLCLLFVLYE